ncbi:hypothetical protein BC332_31030 [Capsicum chinense]|nr:hypothetical protein BC332_31030 [Capsicum chinense]
MSSWNMSRDCFSWDGVIYDEMTGHVIELDLHCSQHFGVIDSNSSLFQLSHLKKLDLSYNYFYGFHILAKFVMFSSLTHLDLANSYFSGKIPFEISHLFKLQSLRHLSTAHYTLSFKEHDFKLLPQNLNHLRELHLYEVNISSTSPLNFPFHLTTLTLRGIGLYGIIPESIFHLPNLVTLDLSNNDQLSGYFPKTKWNNSASLRELILDAVNFSVKELEFLRSAKHLEGLDPSNNKIQGRIPDWAWSNWMFSLQSLNLFYNMLASMGSIPLQHFFISENNLIGEIPSSICHLTSLLMLDLERNNLKGAIPQCLGNISGLAVLDMHNNLSGTLPMTFRIGRNLPTNLFQHLKSMRTVDQTMKAPSYEGDIYYQDSVAVITQGFEREIVSVLFCTQNYDDKEAAKAKELQKKK